MTARPVLRALGAALVLSVCSSACSSERGSTTTETDPAPTARDTAAASTAPPPATSPGTTTRPGTTPPGTTASGTAAPGTDSPAATVTDPPATTDATAVTDAPPPGDRPLTVDELLALPRPLVLAHAGGEDVHPHSTPFAYAESVDAGVDILDFDVHLTRDGVLVVQHDDTVDRTTNGSGTVAEMSYDELNALDNAHWFTPECVCRDRPEAEYVYRGIRTGEKAPPTGYTAEDFVIPRLRDIVERFPSMPLNIEIKATGEAGVATARVLAAELAELDRSENAVVTSFDDAVNDAFRELAPEVEITPGLGASSAWVLDGEPLPNDMRILQLPPEFQGIDVLTPDVIAASADRGYPIWVWPDERAYENAVGYDLLLNMGVSGLNANDPLVAVAAVRAYMAGEVVPAPDDLVADARSAVERAIAEGDDLGDCPFGPTDRLVAQLPNRLPLADGYATAGVEDNGQVFSGGDVDITYCVLTPDDGSDGPLDEIRVDASPLPGVDIATYLDEEFTSDDVALQFAGSLFGGELSTGCWDDPAICGAFWQGDGLFVATVLSGEANQKKPDAVTVARVLLPLVIEGLASPT